MTESKPSKLFVFDLDGTLVHDDEGGIRTIPHMLLHAIHQLSEFAHVVIATGRRYRTAHEFTKILPKIPFLICQNGLVIRDERGQVVHRRGLDFQHVLDAEALVREELLQPIFCFDGEFGPYDFAMSRQVVEGCLAKDLVQDKLRAANTYAFDDLQGLDQSIRSHIVEVAALGPYEELMEAKNRINSRLPDGVRALVVKNCGYGPYAVMEIFDSAASKWSGVEFVSKSLQPGKVFCFGDDENDIEMLMNSDVSVAMGHAEEHVKAAAQELVEGPEGLRQYLIKNFIYEES